MLRDNNRLALQCLVLQPPLDPHVWPRPPQRSALLRCPRDNPPPPPPPCHNSLAGALQSEAVEGASCVNAPVVSWGRGWSSISSNGRQGEIENWQHSCKSHWLFTNSILTEAEWRPQSINCGDGRLLKPSDIILTIALVVLWLRISVATKLNNRI